MSQSSGGRKDSTSHVTTITCTQSPAAAFGEDIADDAYSVSELSHVEEEKRVRRVKGHTGVQPVEGREAFLRTTISKGEHLIDRLQSYIEEGPPTNNNNNNSSPDHTSSSSHQNGLAEVGDASAHSDQSPDGSGNDFTSADTDDAETTSGDSGFADFARTRFHSKGTTHSYSCAALPHPLLPKTDKSDFLASLASWVLILRIMGDLPDRDMTEVLQVAGNQPPVISVVRTNFKTKYTKKDVEDAQAKYSELFKDPTGTDMQSVPFLPDRCESMLEKVQYIICLGIYKPDLRDELYCQLCKQLTNNPSRNSSVRGWVLLSLFAGSFAPSERFAAVFTSFLQDGPGEFSLKVDRLVRRTCSVGTRGYPPSWLEFQAAKNNKPLLVPVTFMNGYRTLCEVDSASTVQELVQNIAEKIGLLDPSGYSVYVTLNTKISCLGHGMHRVMDAISECEQHTKQMGMRESSSLWRLFFRREYFTPWEVPKEDIVNIDLVYQQVMRGVALGEYKCEKEEVLVTLAAQRFYIEYNHDTKFEKLGTFVRSWLNEEIFGQKDPKYYVDKIRECVQTKLMTSKPDFDTLKQDTMLFAKDKWFLLFSRFYDAPKVVGPGLNLSKVVLALNNKGIYIMDESDTIRLHIHYWQVSSINKGRQLTTVRTLKGDDYMVTSNHSEDFFILLTSFVHGLRMRSRFAVVTEDPPNAGVGNSLHVMRTDLVILDQPFSETMDESIVKGVCKRTGAACEVARDKLYVLACRDEPTGDMLGRVVLQLRKDPSSLIHDDNYKPHTLQLYSRSHFRPVSENAVTKLLSKASFKRDKHADSLWQFTKEPLKKPLLKRTCNREELRKPAARAFTAIQQLMGDLVIKQELTDVELVNEFIIDPARRNKYLRDEIYCQLIKQLTNNPDKVSEEKGWNVMTLLCACTTPHGDLFDQVVVFLRGARNRQARACADLLTAQKSCGSRLYPPHAQEHEMTVKGQPNVRLQLVLPSSTVLTLEVGSRTRVSDLKKEVKQRLHLASAAEYSLYLTDREAMHCLPDRSFYFDCLTQAEHQCRKQRRSSNSVAFVPQLTLLMLKKIWVNVTPGEDLEADRCFHFPQEVPNFVRGYHKCSHSEVIQLAALLYRNKFGADASHFVKFSEVAPDILPRGFPQHSSLDDVKKEVEQEFQKNSGLSQDEARSRFLRTAVTWPTYGSVFFEVKQRVSKKLPKYCLLAINTAGVHISDLNTKELLQTNEFNKIPNWAYDDSSFTLIIMAASGNTSKLLFETTVGHNIDDILMSHISWVMNSQMKKKHGFFNNVGESFC